MNKESKKEILNGIQNQISSFDNKASILLTAVGIVFALAISFLDVFHADFFKEINSKISFWFYMCFCAFILSAVVSLTLLVLVIVPRKHKYNKQYPNYYIDVNKLSIDELKTLIHQYDEEDELILEQIKANARICTAKHRLLKAAIISLPLFVTSIIALTLMIIFA